MMEWQKAAESWHQESLEDATGEDIASITVEALGKKGSWREPEAWHHMVGF